MRKLLNRALFLAIATIVGLPQIKAASNDYSIEVKNDAFSKHSRDGLYGITYTEEDASYTNNNWPLVEGYHPYYQSNGSYNIARHQMVRQFGVSMGVVYWINPAEDYIYWWNTVTGENGRTRPTKSYGVGYQDGINNPNFDFEFLGAETGSGAISHDWYGNLVHMWNDGLNGWGTTAGTHFVQGYAVYKSATKYGELMDFIPKLSRMNDPGRENYPFYQRIVTGSTEGLGTLSGTSASDHSVSNYTYYAPSSKTSNPNYPADEVTWNNNWYHHKADESIDKQPTDFLGVSGNLWGVGYIQDPSAKCGDSDYSIGWSTGQVFHSRNDVVYGNMFADGQYTNWYLNYRLSVLNAKNYLAYPNGLFAYYETIYNDSGNAIKYKYKPCATAFANYPTEYLFRETDVLEYFWSTPNGGLVEYNVDNTVRVGFKWDGFVWDLDLGLSMYNYLDETGNRSLSDAMSAPEVDSIKGTRVMIHNLWLQFTPGEDTGNEDKRNGSYMIRSSKYTGGLPDATTPKFSGSPTRTYNQVGYGYGYNKTPNAPEAFINTGVNCWSELERVNDNVFALYTHVPGQGFSKSFITAVKPNNAVSNLKVAKQYMNANNQVVNQLTWTPQSYDRSTMHTYEVWYRRKRSDATEYKDYRTIDGTNRAVWNFAGKASVKYNGATDSTVTNNNNRSGIMPNATFYNSYTAESCTFEHVAPHDTDGTNNYDMVYEYMVIPLYDRSAHRGTESEVVTSTTKAPSCPIEGTFKQVTETTDGVTRYGFSVQLDPKVDITKTGANSAQVMIIVPQDDVTKAALAQNTSVTVSTGDVSESSASSATYSIMGTNDLTVDGYHVLVDGFTVGENGELPTVIWHNVNPELEYKVKVYIVKTSSAYFIPSSVLNTTLVIPTPTISLPEATLQVLSGDYTNWAGNEDMPIGSFRKVEDKENPTNPVNLANANHIGTTGGYIAPLLVTDEVMGTKNNETGLYENCVWEVAYSIYLENEDCIDGERKFYKKHDFYGQNYTTGSFYAGCYSNESSISFDFGCLPVGYEEKTAADGRTRKVYSAAKTPKNYKAYITVAYRRTTADGSKIEVIKKGNDATFVVNLGDNPFPGLKVEESLSALFYQTGSHFYYNDKDNNGYYPHYYNAAIQWNWSYTDALNKYIGYHATSNYYCYGHYESDGEGNATSTDWVEYYPGAVLTNAEVSSLNEAYSNTSELLLGIDYDYSDNSATSEVDETNWSLLAAEDQTLPMKVHYVYGGENKLTEANYSDVKMNIELTAEYPIIVSKIDSKKEVNGVEEDTYNVGNTYVSDADDRVGYSNNYMDVITVPTTISNYKAGSLVHNVVTGVEGILTNAAGGVNLYPNPVGSTFTLQAPMAMDNVAIFTMDGQLVKVVRDINNTTVSINVDELPQGVYIVYTLGIAKMMIKQ